MVALQKKSVSNKGVKFYIKEKGKDIARGYLYTMHNDLHKRPFGFMEDVFVHPSYRGKGHGSKILRAIIAEARKRKCYKLIGTSRYSRKKVHKIYKHLKFKDWGKEFRLNFN